MDPMTKIYSYLENPTQLRGTCNFSVTCFDRAVDLETVLCCPCGVVGGEGRKDAGGFSRTHVPVLHFEARVV